MVLLPQVHQLAGHLSRVAHGAARFKAERCPFGCGLCQVFLLAILIALLALWGVSRG